MLNKTSLALILFLISFSLFSQTRVFVGINPSVNLNRDYPQGAFDLNIAPLTVEIPISNNFDIRLISKLNYGFRTTGGALVSAGAEIGVPIYIHRGEFENNIPNGFYISSGFLLLKNLIYKHNEKAIFFEPGYNFVFNDKFSLSLGLQYGRAYYNYTDGSKLQTNHFGIKVILGFWL
ncbi:MAG: hypothetical protein GX793_09055 [Bacteroidales bacterium]|jgi:hypothetical protein|nr:hypothetical protein [Bacteroidales bacterium]MDY0315298.1 hypothetical protein [Bacteroidales bacterium]NLB87194.1 hypothetical protein [Bacteroidales bacterium]